MESRNAALWEKRALRSRASRDDLIAREAADLQYCRTATRWQHTTAHESSLTEAWRRPDGGRPGETQWVWSNAFTAWILPAEGSQISQINRFMDQWSHDVNFPHAALSTRDNASSAKRTLYLVPKKYIIYIYVYKLIYICIHINVYICIFMYVYIYVCIIYVYNIFFKIYIYKYIYRYINIHIYVYIYIWRER